MQSQKVRALARLAGAGALVGMFAGCVVGREPRASVSGAAAARPRTGPPSALGGVDPQPTAPAEPAPSARAGWVWLPPYWHWDGVRFRRVPGRWEREGAGYRRR
ncbi:MAG: hypothetical protein IT376_03010 [Polyangiaceae bacterium]|nr:hypothetical protein [Polyangiaceae bacterium]